jgi:CRISPR/Cas system-associated protein Cas10 (large subunit of type III CRISPR-Cas system)
MIMAAMAYNLKKLLKHIKLDNIEKGISITKTMFKPLIFNSIRGLTKYIADHIKEMIQRVRYSDFVLQSEI